MSHLKSTGPALGRPRGKNNRIAMTFRFRAPFAAVIKQISERENLSQARVIELCLTRYGKELRLETN
jgi:hypothetical protein